MASLLNIAMKRNAVDPNEILNKIDKAKEIDDTQQRKLKTGSGLIASIQAIIDNVERYLGHKKDNYLLLTNEIEITHYIDKLIAYGYVAIDTETTGLDPIDDDIVGISLYAPGLKAAYIPISHRDYITNEIVPGQPSKEFIKNQLDRFNQNDTKVIMFNSAFDVRVLRHSIGVYLTCWFDAAIAARILNENEFSNKLKDLHKKYILHNQEDEFTFAALFHDVPFNLVPMSVGYLYAAKDAEVTWELFEFQYHYLDVNDPICQAKELQDVASVFWDMEMKCAPVIADMEDAGICLDLNVVEELKVKYLPTLNDAEARYKQSLIDYGIQEQIDISSPTQLAHLFYDILGLKSNDPKQPRGTGKKILDGFDPHPIIDAIKDYRGVFTIINSFILKLPTVMKADGKIHCRFLQNGTDTGRLSSKDPNMQNIPSHAQDIRRMFTASPGYVLIGSDYSQQEPKMTAFMSHDEGLMAAAKTGKDIYSSIAAIAFNKTYEECCEFYFDENGNKTDKFNKEGKERRSQAKIIVLGICYGRGINSLAGQLKCSPEEAQKIYDEVLNIFTGLRQLKEDSEKMAREKGYVTTAWGRRRRLPDMQLPEYTISYTKERIARTGVEEVSPADLQYYGNALANIRSRKERDALLDGARAQGISIRNNNAFIARANRQTVNARIQGSAADMVKIAMVKLANDEELKKLGFRMLLQVHDELIGECPYENRHAAAERFGYVMSHAVEDKMDIPFSTDVSCVFHWYDDVVNGVNLLAE